jgi:hypothetical protein
MMDEARVAAHNEGKNPDEAERAVCEHINNNWDELCRSIEAKLQNGETSAPQDRPTSSPSSTAKAALKGAKSGVKMIAVGAAGLASALFGG